MTTYQVFNEQQSTVVPADADTVPVYDASTGLMGKATVGSIGAAGPAVVATTATTLTLAASTHAGRTLVVSSTAPLAVTLPAASGTGNKYRLFVAVAATATSHTVSCAGSDDLEGSLAIFDTSATDITAIAFAATATDNTVTLDGTTKAGTRGTIVTLEDVASGIWAAEVRGAATGSYATPFSNV